VVRKRRRGSLSRKTWQLAGTVSKDRTGMHTALLQDGKLRVAPFMQWEGVIKGLAYLHGQTPAIIHGDSKPVREISALYTY